MLTNAHISSSEGWRDENHKAVIVAKMGCSDYTMEVHAGLNRDTRALSEMAFSLFETRVAALGLHETNVRRLFQGSADAVNFRREAQALQDLKLGWVEESGEPHHYNEQSVKVMVGLIEGYEAQLPDIRRLTAKARTELARATQSPAITAA